MAILLALLLAAFFVGRLWTGRGAEHGARLLELSLILIVAVLAAMLVRARRRFLLALELVPAPVVLMKPDGRIQLANRRAELLFGIPCGGLVGCQIDEMIPATEAVDFAAERARALAKGYSARNHTLELEIVTREGVVIPLGLTPVPIMTWRGLVLHTTLTDLRSERDSNTDRGRLLSRLETLRATTSEALIEVDSAGLIRAWNQGATELYGQGREEVLGLPVTCLVPPDRQGELRRILQGVAAGAPVRELGCQHITRAGKRRHVQLSASALPDSGEETGSVAVVIRDITDMKHDRALLAEMQQAIESEFPGHARVNAKGKVVESNDTLRGFMGFESVAETGDANDSWLQYFPTSSHRRLEAAYTTMLAKGRAETTTDRFTVLLVSSHGASEEFQGHHLFVG